MHNEFGADQERNRHQENGRHRQRRDDGAPGADPPRASGLRRRMVEILDEFLHLHNMSGSRAAHEPFYFCASDIVVLPTAFCADTLPAFLDGLNQVTIHSIHHHFIEARLRLRRMSNDFSEWLREETGLSDAAEEIEKIDIYANTMEGVRRQIARIVSQAMNLGPRRNEF